MPKAKKEPIQVFIPEGITLFALGPSDVRVPLKIYSWPDPSVASDFALVGMIPCEVCRKTGVVSHECDCSLCNEEKEPCGQCDGRGVVPNERREAGPRAMLAGAHGETSYNVPIVVVCKKYNFQGLRLVERIKSWGWNNCKHEEM